MSKLTLSSSPVVQGSISAPSFVDSARNLADLSGAQPVSVPSFTTTPTTVSLSSVTTTPTTVSLSSASSIPVSSTAISKVVGGAQCSTTISMVPEAHSSVSGRLVNTVDSVSALSASPSIASAQPISEVDSKNRATRKPSWIVRFFRAMGRGTGRLFRNCFPFLFRKKAEVVATDPSAVSSNSSQNPSAVSSNPSQNSSAVSNNTSQQTVVASNEPKVRYSNVDESLSKYCLSIKGTGRSSSTNVISDPFCCFLEDSHCRLLSSVAMKNTLGTVTQRSAEQFVRSLSKHWDASPTQDASVVKRDILLLENGSVLLLEEPESLYSRQGEGLSRIIGHYEVLESTISFSSIAVHDPRTVQVGRLAVANHSQSIVENFRSLQSEAATALQPGLDSKESKVMGFNWGLHVAALSSKAADSHPESYRPCALNDNFNTIGIDLAVQRLSPIFDKSSEYEGYRQFLRFLPHSPETKDLMQESRLGSLKDYDVKLGELEIKLEGILFHIQSCLMMMSPDQLLFAFRDMHYSSSIDQDVLYASIVQDLSLGIERLCSLYQLTRMLLCAVQTEREVSFGQKKKSHEVGFYLTIEEKISDFRLFCGAFLKKIQEKSQEKKASDVSQRAHFLREEDFLAVRRKIDISDSVLKSLGQFAEFFGTSTYRVASKHALDFGFFLCALCPEKGHSNQLMLDLLGYVARPLLAKPVLNDLEDKISAEIDVLKKKLKDNRAQSNVLFVNNASIVRSLNFLENLARSLDHLDRILFLNEPETGEPHSSLSSESSESLALLNTIETGSALEVYHLYENKKLSFEAFKKWYYACLLRFSHDGFVPRVDIKTGSDRSENFNGSDAGRTGSGASAPLKGLVAATGSGASAPLKGLVAGTGSGASAAPSNESGAGTSGGDLVASNGSQSTLSPSLKSVNPKRVRFGVVEKVVFTDGVAPNSQNFLKDKKALEAAQKLISREELVKLEEWDQGNSHTPIVNRDAGGADGPLEYIPVRRRSLDDPSLDRSKKTKKKKITSQPPAQVAILKVLDDMVFRLRNLKDFKSCMTTHQFSIEQVSKLHEKYLQYVNGQFLRPIEKGLKDKSNKRLEAGSIVEIEGVSEFLKDMHCFEAVIDFSLDHVDTNAKSLFKMYGFSMYYNYEKLYSSFVEQFISEGSMRALPDNWDLTSSYKKRRDRVLELRKIDQDELKKGKRLPRLSEEEHVFFKMVEVLESQSELYVGRLNLQIKWLTQLHTVFLLLLKSSLALNMQLEQQNASHNQNGISISLCTREMIKRLEQNEANVRDQKTVKGDIDQAKERTKYHELQERANLSLMEKMIGSNCLRSLNLNSESDMNFILGWTPAEFFAQIVPAFQGVPVSVLHRYIRSNSLIMMPLIEAVAPQNMLNYRTLFSDLATSLLKLSYEDKDGAVEYAPVERSLRSALDFMLGVDDLQYLETLCPGLQDIESETRNATGCVSLLRHIGKCKTKILDLDVSQSFGSHHAKTQEERDKDVIKEKEERLLLLRDMLSSLRVFLDKLEIPFLSLKQLSPILFDDRSINSVFMTYIVKDCIDAIEGALMHALDIFQSPYSFDAADPAWKELQMRVLFFKHALRSIRSNFIYTFSPDLELVR